MQLRRTYLPLLIALLALAPGGIARGEDTSALIGRTLDQQITLNVSGDLPTVLARITRETGVQIQPDANVYPLLPWGDQTTVSANIANATLRQALTAITQKLGLTWTLEDQDIALHPCPALLQLARRATLGEIAALDLLAQTPLAAEPGATSTAELLSTIDAQLASMHAPYSIEDRAINQRSGNAAKISIPRGATIMQALDAMSDQTDDTWSVWGNTILVLTHRDQMLYQLSRPISARFDGEDVSQVLTDLAARSGVPFQIATGALAAVPAKVHTITLVLDNAAVSQALESICGLTGLQYDVTAKGVSIRYVGSDAAEHPATQP